MDGSSNKRRGFVILIILAVIATSSVVLATQLSSVEGQQGAQLRANEEVKARDVAERCLAVADRYAKSYGDANVDFDHLLDPDGTIGTGDDFLPPSALLSGTTAVVSVPPSASGTFYNYRAFNVGTAGTCFIRYDDNSDDSNSNLPAITTNNSGSVGEGGGVDVPQRDRDRTVITTVIGVVPQRSSFADAYANAHARATVRRIRSMPSDDGGGAAIFAGGSVDLDGSVCGAVAGVTADSISGGACVCGKLDAQLVSGSQGSPPDCSGCGDCASKSGSQIGSGTRTDPVVDVPAFSSMLANVAFGKPGSSGNNIASATYGVAAVYVRDAEAPHGAGTYASAGYQNVNSADVFAWDPDDDDVATTLGLPAFAAFVTTDCRDTSGLDPLPQPCAWNNAGGTPTAVTCNAGESPCWKLVARLAEGGHLADLDVRGSVTREEQSSAGDTTFAPRSNALPNFKNAKTWSALAPGTCTTCGGTTVITPSGNDYTVATTAKADTPSMIVAIETTTSAKITLGQGQQDTNFARLGVLAQSEVDIPLKTHQCCAACSASCDLSGCAVPAPSTVSQSDGTGFAVRTSGNCVAATNDVTIFGTLQCNSVDFDGNNICLVGGIIANGAGPGPVSCSIPGSPATFCSSGSGICFKNNPAVLGDLVAAGNVCLKNNISAVGNIESQSNVGWKNNGNFHGSITAQGNVVAKNNGTVTFDGSSGGTNAQGVASALYIDASW